MKFIPYLNFNGDCRQAFEFYHQVFGGNAPEFYTNADVPMEGFPPDWEDKILHAHLDVNGQELMASDVPPDMYETPKSVSVSVHLTDATEAERIFTELASGGSIFMPWGEQPWGAMFGMASDRFGIPWMINCELSR